MKDKLKKYEGIIYFVMGLATIIMLLIPGWLLLLLLNGDLTEVFKSSYTNEFIKNPNIVKIMIVTAITMAVITWVLIEGLLINLLKIIKNIRKEGMFEEKNRKSIEKMIKYLVAFGISYLLVGTNTTTATSGINSSVIRDVGGGVGNLYLSGITIEITVYTIVLLIIYILIRVVSIVFSEAMQIKEINNEIV